MGIPVTILMNRYIDSITLINTFFWNTLSFQLFNLFVVLRDPSLSQSVSARPSCLQALWSVVSFRLILNDFHSLQKFCLHRSRTADSTRCSNWAAPWSFCALLPPSSSLSQTACIGRSRIRWSWRCQRYRGWRHASGSRRRRRGTPRSRQCCWMPKLFLASRLWGTSSDFLGWPTRKIQPQVKPIAVQGWWDNHLCRSDEIGRTRVRHTLYILE